MGTGPVPLRTDSDLYRAEHRALRELHATSRQITAHWRRLADRIGDPQAASLRAGAETARGLTHELGEQTARYGLHGFPAAQGAGSRLAGLRNKAGDLLLERNQALRLAVLDAEHVALLLAYLGALAEQRADTELAAFHHGWETRIRAAAAGVRAAVIALASDHEGAILPAEPSPLGRAGHGVATAIGTLGEAVDGSPIGRAARRRSGASGSSGRTTN